MLANEEAGPAAPSAAPATAAPPATTRRVELYTHEPMVNWLSPLQLLRTAVRVTVARTIGAFADARAVQAALNPVATNPPIPVTANAPDGAVWVDYLADTGDGWHSTYSMALCASHPARLAADGVTLPRAQVLLLGGDQVYPTPAHGGYRTRFLDPFRAACPAPLPPDAAGNSEAAIAVPGAPLMVATPGNHDWYDGLRGFAQLFCTGAPVGGWQTRQRTSYYVLQLPHGWWIWGLDLQLESEIDRQQFDYFKAMHDRLAPGDRVVLCTPEPSWIDEMERLSRTRRRAFPSTETRTPRFRSLSRIERLLGDHLVAVLAGDKHHYARYTPEAGTTGPERVTCGGGGAFLHGTHQLPASPEPVAIGRTRQRYVLAGAAYPDRDTSRTLRNRAWQLPVRNVGLCTLFAAICFLFNWIVQSASRATAPPGQSLMQTLAALPIAPASLGDAWRALWMTLANSPASVAFAVAVMAFFAALSTRGTRSAVSLAGLVGALHGLLHVALAAGLFWALARLNLHVWGLHADDGWMLPLLLAQTLFAGGVLGGLLFGVWMVIANQLWGLHAEEVFSSQSIADYKSLLRMRFDADTLTIHPLKLEKVCRHWKLGPGLERLNRMGRTWRVAATPAASGPRFVPDAGEPWPPDALARTEPPIVIRRTGAAP
ncbi:preprotein translocase subunit YajC [Cupriavidus pauculus]|uniref:Preprotein translocase subunit YajC n=1 Tax=Cupriavidus pauculus TaxID=82633 RepID=A0A3G8H4H1_9BURK|nr:preprotein translocase subunit YajC [Cupriavidus pauculus]AZG14412.1 preprotein translocase subunit YajC [Cupriavidus pauculus]